MRQKSTILVAILVASCVAVNTYGLHLESDSDPLNVAPYLEYLITDEELSIEDVWKRESDFVPHVGDSLNFGFLKSNLWLRLRFHEDSELENQITRFLILSKIHIRKLDYFHYVNGSLIREQHTGTDLPYSSRDVNIPQYAFQFDERVGAHEVYLRVRTNSPLQSKVSVSSAGHLLKTVTDQQFYYGMILGFFALASLLSGVLALTTGQRSITYGCLLMCGAFSVSLTNSGLGFETLWPETPGLNPIVSRISLGFSIGMAGLFTVEFLNLKNIAPRLELTTRISALLLISMMLFPIFSVAPIPAMITIILVPVLTLVSAYYARTKKTPGANLILTGFLLFLACVGTSTVASFGLLPDQFEYGYLFDIGMIMMGLIMAYGLAIKINENSLAAAVASESVKAKSLFLRP